MSDSPEAASMRDKRALVTGAASGIGAALVAQLCAGGAQVMAVDIQASALAELASEHGCETQVVDVTTEQANRDMVATTIASLGELDLVFLNAGILGRTREEQGQPYRVGDLDLDQYRKVMAVNTDSVIYGTVAAAPHMRDGGGIIVTASAAGLVPWKPTPFYSATKHAVVGWARATSDALAEQNITINAICPGGVATALLGLTADVAKDVPKLLDPATVAAAAIDTALGAATGTAVSVVASRDPVVQTHSFTSIPDFP